MKKRVSDDTLVTISLALIIGGLILGFILAGLDAAGVNMPFIPWGLLPILITGGGCFLFCWITTREPKPQKPTDPWIEVPKAEKKEEKDEPLPKIWKEKVLA